MTKTVRFIVVFLFCIIWLPMMKSHSVCRHRQRHYPRQAMTSDLQCANLNRWRWPTLRDFNFRWV